MANANKKLFGKKIRHKEMKIKKFNESLGKTMTREEVIEMLIDLAGSDPDLFHKYQDDDDQGESAYTSIVDRYIINNNI